MNFAASVPGFRRCDKRNIRHRLNDIIILMILGRTCGHVGRSDIIEFGNHNLNKFRKMGMLKNGVPSEATLCRVENGIDDSAMADRMQEFVGNFHDELLNACRDREIICVDGKAERGTVQENGRNPDIVSAYSYNTGITIATEACQEKSNEIKAVPILIDKIDISGKIVTADAMSLQKDIIERIRTKGGDFLIELKANQRSLRYGVEDKLREHTSLCSYIEGPEFGHGRIETRTYNIYDGLEIIADKKKWGGYMTIIEYESFTSKKSTGVCASEKPLYVSSLPTDTPRPGAIVRNHWSIESMHWGLDVNLLQDKVKRKSAKAARNLDTIQRMVYSVFYIWKGLRKKRSDKRKGVAELIRHVSMNFTRLMRFLCQK
ncbi:ISAs1 family transposase [Muribaculum intestinale]|uniref:ISAs1 family transposase n=1 Tax=Muribaculum intestinale TaxID=1796646 RepID=A0A4S2FPM3_9BACT|nr:ISAs1 family transposase [Muribaculum intestinale]MYM13953.1 ISAs1 family transposase [Muribaculum intestinale]TGY71002.1 ISAs1 family transposase [Muribaculum intestinale]